MPSSLDSPGIFFATIISPFPLLFCPRYDYIYSIMYLVFFFFAERSVSYFQMLKKNASTCAIKFSVLLQCVAALCTPEGSSSVVEYPGNSLPLHAVDIYTWFLCHHLPEIIQKLSLSVSIRKSTFGNVLLTLTVTLTHLPMLR